MENSQLIAVLALAASSLLSCLLFQYLLGRRQGSKSAFYMAFLMAACGAWAALNAFEYIARGLSAKLFFANLQYASIAAVPVLWYAFGSALNREERSGSGRDPLRAIWIIPTITAVLVWADPSLGLVRRAFRLEEHAGFAVIGRDFGPWFWVHSVYSYTLIIAGTALILRGLRSSRGMGKARTLLLVAGSLLPIGANLLFLADMWPNRFIDPTPLAFSLNGLLLSLNLSRYRFLGLVGAAQAAAIEQLRDAVLVLDGRGMLAYANVAAKRTFGLGALDLGKGPAELGAHLPELSSLRSGTGELSRGELLFETHAGDITRDGRVIGQVLTLIDVTRRVVAERSLIAANRDLEDRIAQRTKALEESALRLSDELEHRTRSERQLYHDALHDPLTRLANRNLVSSRIEQAILRSRRDASFAYGLLYLDFDGFKSVNDSYGHDTGDAFLREVSLRIKRNVREVDTVARMGGDEFVVLMEGVSDFSGVEEIVDRVADAISVPIAFGQNVVVPSASIGIVMGRPDCPGPEECLRDADLAMYAAKAAGKNGRVLFKDEMRQHYTTQNRLLGDLRTAISSGGMSVAFQLIVRMDGTPVGCEVLARWRHAELGPVGPDLFIPLAESSGLIVPLGTLILIETLKTASSFVEAGILDGAEGQSSFFFSVNVSAIQLSQPDFAELILSSIDRHGVPRSMIHLEITETAIMENRETVMAVVDLLSEAGLSFKLDDFGTGYSSLGYLHRIPIDSVKIDRGFIERIGNSPEGASASDGLVRGIISLAHGLGKTVVSEGIETAAQVELLREYGCDYGQGYFFGKPASKDALASSLRK